MFDTFGHVQRRPARSLVASLVVHIAAVIAIVTVPLFVPGPPLEMNLSTATEIVFPLRVPVPPPHAERPAAAKLERLRQPASTPEAAPVERATLVPPPQPRIEPRFTESPKLQLASPEAPHPNLPPTLEPVRPAAEPAREEPQIELGRFAGASVALPTPNEVSAAQAVDSFGAVKPDRQGARWRTTSYERSGFGAAAPVDGKAPKDVAPTENAQAGSSFGSATAKSPAGGPAGSVHNAGFGQVVAGERDVEVERVVEPAAATSAARVLAKPPPEYTDEARRLRIEGDVRLRVNFRADATVEVLQIIEGLGHGLDESAVRAARRIEFAPAEQSGKPVDFIADVFIRFRLAY